MRMRRNYERRMDEESILRQIWIATAWAALKANKNTTTTRSTFMTPENEMYRSIRGDDTGILKRTGVRPETKTIYPWLLLFCFLVCRGKGRGQARGSWWDREAEATSILFCYILTIDEVGLCCKSLLWDRLDRWRDLGEATEDAAFLDETFCLSVTCS